MTKPTPGPLVPYLFYADVEAMIDWYTRVFGFVEKDRWRDDTGKVTNAEMHVGDTELWMDGDPTVQHHFAREDGEPLPPWIGVWLADSSDVDATYEHIVSEGVEPEGRPADRPFGVRIFNVSDPEGYTWGFMCRIPRSA